MEPTSISRYDVLPLPDHQLSIRVDGDERLRWHFGPNYPRPFFYPLVGPAGQPLTRMGHPGAPNHDHHQSIWFAHNKVLGIDFWGNAGTARIKQKQWLAYQENRDAAMMAVQLGWYDGHDPRELLEQELIAIVRAGDHRETLVEIQTTFRPAADMLEFGKTNFGFLAVRVAKSISEHFGAGKLTNSEGAVGEPAIFGKPARWMDYSGPLVIRTDAKAESVVEGITYFDHPSNPRYPTPWHVRSDGWMGAAICLNESLATTRQQPLALRYLLHAHRGPIDRDRADAIAKTFQTYPQYLVRRSTRPHVMYEVVPKE
jgi:hypothetical protein